MENGYAICMNEWALDKDIKNELGLLLIISSLCAEKGYCFASNKYLGELFDLPEQTISRKIKILEEKKYITIEYKKRGCEIIDRKIRLTKMLTDDKQNCEPTINKNVKDNNTSINNTSINKKEKYKKEKYFEEEELNDLFNEFLEIRKKKKAVNSERAINMLIKKLSKYDDITKMKMIEQSIVNSWKDIYELKEQKKTSTDRMNEVFERFLAKED